MKRILTIIILTLVGQILLAQKQTTRTEIDTIERFPNKAFVEYKTFSDSVLTEEAQAYLYPTILKFPKYRILRNVFTTEVEVDSIVFHGKRTTYLKTGEFKVEKFEYGTLLSTSYFNSKGEQISVQDFKSLSTVRGPCGNITRHYFIRGKKEKERKKESEK